MSSSYEPSPNKYDVFISFRGDDTRTNFTSHLHTAFNNHGIKTYIDYKLERSDEEWPALVEAIQNSQVSVVVFSENYASSKWCLKELAKILDCRRNQGQVVIPVFYRIYPSHVRKQTGNYEEAFMKHERDLRNDESNQYKVSKWRSVLTEAANISGWSSHAHENDSQLIQSIMKDVLDTLNLRNPHDLVGIDENFVRIVSLLKKFQVIGIWGMPGIGKTTIAKVVFSKLFPHYDSVCFLENVREEAQKQGLSYLCDKLLFKLLKDEKPRSNVMGSTFIMRRLKCEKVFIVLDDVDDFSQLEYLGEICDLGPDSRLIITSRDRNLLTTRVEKVYELKKLDYRESVKLFSLQAFKSSEPQVGYEDLVERAISYARGVPLALKVLGSYLCYRSRESWESALHKLEKYPHEIIQRVSQVSYDGLDDLEKAIFLDIAFFFKDEYKDSVIRILDACGFNATWGIEVL